MDNQQTNYLQVIMTSWALPILLIGSIVDIVQCVWLLKRWFFRMKRKLYNRLKHEIELEQVQTKKLDAHLKAFETINFQKQKKR